MSRRRRQRPRARRSESATAQREASTRVSKITAWILGVASLLGTVITVYLLPPNVSISAAGYIPRNELATPFLVTNNGPLPIYDVTPTCFVERLTDTGGTTLTLGRTSTGRIAKTLSSGEHTTVACTGFFRTDHQITLIDVSIAVSCWTWLRPWHHEIRRQRFSARRGDDGAIHWYPTATER